MGWVAIGLAVLGLAGQPTAPAGSDTVQGRCRDGRTWTSSLRAQGLMFGLINQERAEARRPPVRHHAVMDRMAMAHAADMACRNYFDHRNRERDSLPDRLRRVNDGTLGRWSHLAEIIGTSDTASRQVERWLGSRSHKRAMLEPAHDHAGIGLVRIDGSKYDTYWAVEFVSLKPETDD